MPKRLCSSTRCAIFLALFWGLCAAISRAENLAPQASLPADVRMIIDISGSMKKTDPLNLRRPAVDLMVRLLPEKSKAGIWTFGQSVNMLVPIKTVDAAWREASAKAAGKINSIALYTNIGAALEKATDDAQHLDPGYEHNVILLTDGVVDISKEAVANIAERKRILTEVLPRLKAAGFKIHTIALSDAADQELMKKLSGSTDGLFVVAKNADELMSTFLKIFEQAVPEERLPIDENGFLVDSSIQEFTALIFRRDQVPATLIVAPDGTEFSATDPSHNVNWYKTDKYDLITVQHPAAGQWRVKTEMAPNSRVTVVSNLKLMVAPLKNSLRPQQEINLNYSFSENEQTILKKEFLALLSATVAISHETNPQGQLLDLASNNIPEDGIFHAALNGFDEEGDYTIRLSIDGKTFKREFVHHLNVTNSLFTVERALDEQEKTTYSYQLLPNVNFVEPEKIKVIAAIETHHGAVIEKELRLANQKWSFAFSPTETAEYTINFKVLGVAMDGVAIDETLTADHFYFPNQASVETAHAAPANHEAEDNHTEQPKHEEAPKHDEPSHEEEAQAEESHLWLYVAIGIANLLVVILGYFAYRIIAGGKAKEATDEIEKTLNIDVNSLKKNSPEKVVPKSEPKTVIDVADEDQMAEIPMQDNLMEEDDDKQMAENLFPLDNLEDPEDKK